MKAARRIASLLIVGLVLGVAACASSGEPDRSPAGGRLTGPASAPSQQPRPPATPNALQEEPMRIRITVAGQQFHATLFDSAASRDLATQLPLTLQMVDHGGVEKTGPLPALLSLSGQPAGADPGVGDVGYYAPGHDFVLYYGDQSYYPGIVVLGQLEGDAGPRLAEVEGTITATIENANVATAGD